MSAPPGALVTGASSGIGAAFARALHRRGYAVALVARRGDRLAALASELRGDTPPLAIPADLRDRETPARVAGELEARGFRVDLLVNNAGAGATGLFHELPAERSLDLVDLNARAVVAMTRLFLPPMVARGKGAIVNVVSTSAFQPVPFFSVYGASKAFVLSFTEALAFELGGTGVRVQALCPGLTRTEFQDRAGTERVRFNRTAAMTPEAVVERSLRALDRGTLRVIPGALNRLTVGLQALVPRALVRRVAAELFRPR